MRTIQLLILSVAALVSQGTLGQFFANLNSQSVELQFLIAAEVAKGGGGGGVKA